jgi:hypothetical protein
MKNLTASLDKVAAELQAKGHTALAAEIDQISNTLEVLSSEDVEAGIASKLLGAIGLAAISLVSAGKASDFTAAVELASKQIPKENVIKLQKSIAQSPAMQQAAKGTEIELQKYLEGNPNVLKDLESTFGSLNLSMKAPPNDEDKMTPPSKSIPQDRGNQYLVKNQGQTGTPGQKARTLTEKPWQVGNQ